MLPIKVPEDVLRFGDKLSIYFDRGWKIGDTLHIQMGEIFDLSKFWIAIETNLDKLMKDLQYVIGYFSPVLDHHAQQSFCWQVII